MARRSLPSVSPSDIDTLNNTLGRGSPRLRVRDSPPYEGTPPRNSGLPRGHWCPPRPGPHVVIPGGGHPSCLALNTFVHHRIESNATCHVLETDFKINDRRFWAYIYFFTYLYLGVHLFNIQAVAPRRRFPRACGLRRGNGTPAPAAPPSSAASEAPRR